VKREFLVSIIIPCYNQAQYLPETLQSVLNQTYTNWECIIVNDGSPDNTEEIALNWVQKDGRFRYLKKCNGGLADARNFGIRVSVGQYILPLDSDDCIEKSYIEKATKVLDEHPEIGIVYSKASFFENKTGTWNIPKYSIKRNLTQNTIFCSALFRRSDYDTTDGYNTNMIYGYEDWDFWLSILELRKQVYRIPENLFFYRYREKSMRGSINWDRMIFLHKQIIQNHLELYQKHFKNPYIIVDYLEFRKGLSGGIAKTALYILKNLSLKVFIFIIRYKLNLIFRLKAAIFQ
jgi:glycosyltransferase involved in cell wall biosynthesis